MDIQRKKGLLEICVLATLLKEASYGYKIISDVSTCIEVSESTLYPILRRLEANGCVSTFVETHNGRMRKYFKITDLGTEKIDEYLAEIEEQKRIIKFIEEAKA